MTEQTTETRESSPETDVRESDSQWVTAEFVEQSACAEICAYVFSA